MKRILFISLFIFSLVSNSQIRNFGDNLYGYKSKIFTITLKPMLNTNYLTLLTDKLDDVPEQPDSEQPSISNPSIQEIGDEPSLDDDSDTTDIGDSDSGSFGEDLLNLGSYDVKVRITLGKNVSLINQVIVNGDSLSGYRYTSGIIITF